MYNYDTSVQETRVHPVGATLLMHRRAQSGWRREIAVCTTYTRVTQGGRKVEIKNTARCNSLSFKSTTHTYTNPPFANAVSVCVPQQPTTWLRAFQSDGSWLCSHTLLGPLSITSGCSRGRSLSSAHDAGHGALEQVVVPWTNNTRGERGTKQVGNSSNER